MVSETLIILGMFVICMCACVSLGYSLGSKAAYKDLRDLAIQFADVNIGFYNQQKGVTPSVQPIEEFNRKFETALKEAYPEPAEEKNEEISLMGGML